MGGGRKRRFDCNNVIVLPNSRLHRGFNIFALPPAPRFGFSCNQRALVNRFPLNLFSYSAFSIVLPLY